MFGIILSGALVVWAAYMMVAKKYKPQSILLICGLTLLAAAAATTGGPLLPPKQSTGSVWLDMFEIITRILNERTGSTGMIIMAIAGFSAYMDHVGASKSLFALVAAPLRLIRSPYMLLVGSFFVTQVLVLFIPSHTGLGLLLMATMYPILIRVGISKLSAISVIGCCQFIDHGPASQAQVFASGVCNLEPAVYFVKYQLPVTIPIILGVAMTHYFVQRWWDKREGYQVQEVIHPEKGAKEERPPLVYAILPVVPLLLILAFSPVFHSPIKMNVTTAMIISGGIALVFEYFRLKTLHAVLDSLSIFFEGMGKIFALVVTLIVAGETFGAGLMKIGVIDTLIQGAQNIGLGIHAMIIIMCLVLAAAAFLMGSGNAAFFSLAPVTPKIAALFNVDTVTFLLPMQIMTSFGRTVSPIAAPMAAIAGLAEVSPLQLVKRTAIPMVVAGIINIVANFIIFVK
jgi:C4-dicarboxylate transporter, DcuC family